MPQMMPRPTFALSRWRDPDARDWDAYLARAVVAPDPGLAAETARAAAMELAVCGPRAARGRGSVW